MAISLKKREPISLKKMGNGIENIKVGIEWAVVSKPRFDIDLMAFICENRTKRDGTVGPQVIDDVYTVFFGNKTSADGSFSSSGDDLGHDGGGAESVIGNLALIDKRAIEVAFVATIDKADVRKQCFGQCTGGKIFVINNDTGEELATWTFGPGAFTTETALHVGSLFMGDNGWEFMAVGEGGVKSFEDIAIQDYGYPA